MFPSSATTIGLPLFGEYVNISPVLRLWSFMYIDFVGIKISVIPVPGFEKNIVLPIPTPDVVPKATDSLGSKYNSLLSL